MITVIEPEWGLSTWKIDDARLVFRVHDLITKRTAKAKELGFVVSIECTSTFYVTALTGDVLGAQLLHNPHGNSIVVFSCREEPALALEIKKGSSVITVHYAGERPHRSQIERRLYQLHTLRLTIPEKSPYGWAENGRITTLIFNAPTIYEKRRKQFCGGEPYVYVLKGTSMPSFLRMPNMGSDKDWPDRFTDAIQVGELIHLAERFHNLPGEIWSIGDGYHHYLRFEKVDNTQPSLVVGTPYLYFHPREAYPGELFKRTEKAQLRLRKWLSW